MICNYIIRMIAKLTLSVPSAIIQKGKQIAQAKSMSLSELVTRYLQELDTSVQSNDIDTKVASMYGAYSLPKGQNIADIKFQALVKKHLAI